eukprot:2073615-Amphidinium_carterae.3
MGGGWVKIASSCRSVCRTTLTPASRSSMRPTLSVRRTVAPTGYPTPSVASVATSGEFETVGTLGEGDYDSAIQREWDALLAYRPNVSDFRDAERLPAWAVSMESEAVTMDRVPRYHAAASFDGSKFLLQTAFHEWEMYASSCNLEFLCLLLECGGAFEIGAPCSVKFLGRPNFHDALVYHTLRQCSCHGRFRVMVDLGNI